MKILFKNVTKYDKENRDNFINFHKEKYGRKEIVKTILFFIIVLYLLIFNIVMLNWKYFLILIPICVLCYFINEQVKNKRKDKKAKQKNKEFTFYFYERYVKIKFKRQFDRMNYFEFKKIFETNENFFLYTDEKHSLILDKDGFEEGNAKEFSEFIKRKCPFKYSSK